jgi:hypothetical protein
MPNHGCPKPITLLWRVPDRRSAGSILDGHRRGVREIDGEQTPLLRQETEKGQSEERPNDPEISLHCFSSRSARCIAPEFTPFLFWGFWQYSV